MRQSDERVNSFQHKIPVNDNSALFSRISYRLCQDVRLVLVRLSGPATLLHLDHLLVLVNQVFQAVLDRLWHPFVQVFQEFQVVLSTTTTTEPVLFTVVHVTFTASFDHDQCLINRPSFSCIKKLRKLCLFRRKVDSRKAKRVTNLQFRPTCLQCLSLQLVRNTHENTQTSTLNFENFRGAMPQTTFWLRATTPLTRPDPQALQSETIVLATPLV